MAWRCVSKWPKSHNDGYRAVNYRIPGAGRKHIDWSYSVRNCVLLKYL